MPFNFKSFILTFVMISVTGISYSQSKKQLNAHRAAVDTSLKSKTALLSLDSFYCSGVKLAVIHHLNTYSMNGMDEYYVLGLGSNDTLMKVKVVMYRMHSDGSGSDVRYSHFYFPSLRSECDVMDKTDERDILETICKHNLVNRTGLDTFKAETFVTLKGTYQNSLRYKQYASVNFKMAQRNRKANVDIKGNDIYQDSVIIGSYEEVTLTGPDGVKLQQIKVYNRQKQIVSTSIETKPGSLEWRTVTQPDNKYHTIRTPAEKDQYLFKILGFVIENMYL